MMPHELLLLLVGLLYALAFRLLAFLRREGFSTQFILEAVGITAVVVALSYLTELRLNPVLFLAGLYTITLRSRLLVDLANLAARSGRLGLAERIYGLAWRLWPNETGRMVIATNQAAIMIVEKRLSEASRLLERVLEDSDLPPKYAAAANYNLGVAYRDQGEISRAIKHFHDAVEALPNSVYGLRAKALMQRISKTKKPPPD
jgi:tetratricopeptide (TPR) repeat protein